MIKRATLIMIAIIMGLPFLLMLDGSFQTILGTGNNIGSVIRIIPRAVTLQNYRDLLKTPFLWLLAINSAIMVAGYTIPAVIVNGLVAYAFAFYKFSWKKVAFICAMATFFIPGSAIIIPRYMAGQFLGLRGIPAVLVMVVFDASTIFVFRAYFESIPISLIEIAKIDGAKDWQIFRQVVLPLCAPIVAATVVFRAVSGLGDYLWQLINLNYAENRTLIVGLYDSIYVRGMERKIIMGFTSEFGYSLAVGVVLMAPMVLIFFLASKYFLGGLTLGAVKE